MLLCFLNMCNMLLLSTLYYFVSSMLFELSLPYVTMSTIRVFVQLLLFMSIILLVIIDKTLNFNKFYNLPNL